MCIKRSTLYYQPKGNIDNKTKETDIKNKIFVYLAAIIDIYSRKIVGYAMGKTCYLLNMLSLRGVSMAVRNFF